MDRDFVVPASVWSNTAFASLGARSKLAYIYLFGKADIAGIGKYVEGEMEKALLLSISVGDGWCALLLDTLVLYYGAYIWEACATFDEVPCSRCRCCSFLHGELE